MRKFSSYGPVDTDLHYYAPRQALIERAYTQMIGENPDKGGHTITVWGPRQTGKTWIMQQVLWRLQMDDRFNVIKVNLEHLKTVEDVKLAVQSLAKEIIERLGLTGMTADRPDGQVRLPVRAKATVQLLTRARCSARWAGSTRRSLT